MALEKKAQTQEPKRRTIAMLKALIEQARTIPQEVERLAVELAAKKQALHDLLALRQAREAEVAGEVANETNGDGKKRFPNEEARRAEISRRLSEDALYQDSERELREIRAEVVELEARLERMKLEHRSTTTLLSLVAAAVQGGNEQILKAVLEREVEAKQEPKQEAKKADGLKEAKVTVLGLMPTRKEGVVNILFREGETQFDAYANGKNGVSQKLAQAIGKEVRVKLKKLDSGRWFVVQVA